MALEVGQHDHGIVILDVCAHGHFLENEAVLYGEHHFAVFVHDIHVAEGPAVYLEGFAVLFGSVAVAFVPGVGLHNLGVGNLCLEFLDPFAGQNIGTVLFAGVELDGNTTGDALVDFLVQLNEASGTQVLGEIDVGNVLSGFLLFHGFPFRESGCEYGGSERCCACGF